VSDDALLRIGPFSRASWLSIEALRAYHGAGLLVPAAVDPHTGYRSYSAAQLADPAVIRRLRQLDVPSRSSDRCSA
jgi:DNA-binding transcriptional MerR regulator